MSRPYHPYDDERGDPTRIWHDRGCTKAFTDEVFRGGPAVLLGCYETDEGVVLETDIDVETCDITSPAELTTLLKLLVQAGETAWPGFQSTVLFASGSVTR